MKVAIVGEVMLEFHAQPVTAVGLAYGGEALNTARLRRDRPKHPITDATVRRS